MSRSHSKSSKAFRLFLAAGLAPAVLTAAANAQTLNWFNAAGGPASTAANWNPAAVPGAANDLIWNLNNTYTVTFNSSTTASRTHLYRQGAVTLNVSSPHTVSNGITIGDANALTGTMTLTSGTLNSTASMTLGSVAGSVGNLNVTDDSANLIITGATADMTVGSNGDAAVSITGGGLVQVADQFILGSNSSSSPTLTVSGAQAVSPFQRSTLNVVGVSQSRFGAGGDATVNISNGALADFAGSLVVSNGSASVSTVTVAGPGGIGGIVNAELDVAGDLLLGQNTSAGTAAGTATLNVNADGSVFVGGTLHVGNDPDGGAATLNINSGGLVQATNVIDGSLGTINHNGGTLRINGGTYTGHADPLVVTGTAGPTLHLTAGLSKTLTSASQLALVVGDDAGAGTFSGSLLIDGGAELLLSGPARDIHIGDDAGTTGTITVSGAGSQLVATEVLDDILVGVNGTGTLRVENGGQVLARNILVPSASSTADGTLITSAIGSPIITTVNLTVGNSVGGPGDVVLNDTAVLNATDPGFGVVVRTTGVLGVANGALLNATGGVLVDGGVLRVNGTVQAGTEVNVGTGGALVSNSNPSGTPLVDAPVLVGAGGVLEAVLDDFTVGDAASADGFVAEDGSLITIDAVTLTLLDADYALVDDITINGGEIIAPNGLEIVTPGQNGQMDGTGIFTGSQLFMESGGSVITATGANGITINGQFRNNSGNIDGTKYTFNDHPGSMDPAGWVGAGAINARVVFNAGTEVFALANMTMGLNASDGVVFNSGSQMHLNARNITLVDSNGLALPTLTDMNGGILTSLNGLVVNNGRVLRGHGDVVTTNSGLTVFGTIDPDSDPELDGVYEDLGDFDVTGTYAQGANSHYFCDVAGLDNEFRPMNDRIDATGVATLNGTLEVSLIFGYVPVTGDHFTILTGSSVVGTFSTVNKPSNFEVVYHPTFVELVVTPPCDPDVNCDGAINGFDVEATEQAVNGDFSNFCLPSADLNGDGAENGFDIETAEQRVNGAPC